MKTLNKRRGNRLIIVLAMLLLPVVLVACDLFTFQMEVSLVTTSP